MARYLRRLSLIACSFWIGCAFQREYTMGQPLTTPCQNHLAKVSGSECQLPLIAPDHLPRRERDVRKSDPNVWWCTTELPYARPTAASMRAMSAGSRTPRASAVMHSRSSVRFFTPKTTVATPVMDSAYRCARDAGDSPSSRARVRKGALR